MVIAAAAGEGAVKAIVASSFDKLITAHQDHKIRVLKVHHQKKITQLATLPTLSDRATKLLLPGNHVQVHHVDAVSALALSNSLLYSVSWDRTLKVWRTGDFKCLQSVVNAHDDAINAVAVKNGAVYTGSSDGRIKVWRRKQGEKSYSLDAILAKHKVGVNALAMSGDDAVLYSGASDALICAWRNESGGEMAAVAVLRGHAKAVLCLAAVADHVICSGSADQTVRVWRGIGKASYACLAILEGHRGPIKCITVHASSDATSHTCLLYSAALDCDIKVRKLCLSI
ncbi:hypothetical protein SASPL_136198 [Salvia splendens]|uniref:Uncharacterized protein n=2 Tax=Salvia splendens TaxID=180675 RepID=A0A8X8ZHA9_SALSN|nr:hypothetical protein SASPL_136198 [Salvia splendens]